MKFKEADIGTIFKFTFDGDRNWWYVKTDSNRAICIQAPATNASAMGVTYKIDADCYESEIKKNILKLLTATVDGV